MTVVTSNKGSQFCQSLAEIEDKKEPLTYCNFVGLIPFLFYVIFFGVSNHLELFYVLIVYRICTTGVSVHNVSLTVKKYSRNHCCQANSFRERIYWISFIIIKKCCGLLMNVQYYSALHFEQGMRPY